MAYTLPLPSDIQIKIHYMVKTEEQKGVVLRQLEDVFQSFWSNIHDQADYIIGTYWMEEDEEDEYSPEHVDACFDLVNRKLDRDNYVCNFDHYRNGLCFHSFATKHPDGFSYVKHCLTLPS